MVTFWLTGSTYPSFLEANACAALEETIPIESSEGESLCEIKSYDLKILNQVSFAGNCYLNKFQSYILNLQSKVRAFCLLIPTLYWKVFYSSTRAEK